MSDMTIHEAPGAKGGRRKSEKRRRNSVVSVRLSEEEREAIEQRARETGTQVGALMRTAALNGLVAPTRGVVHRGAETYLAPFNSGPTFVGTLIVTDTSITATGSGTTATNG